MFMKTFWLITVCFLFWVSAIYADGYAYVKTTDVYERIKSAIDDIQVISSHSHLGPPPETPPDFFDLFTRGGYVGWDITRLGNTFEFDYRFKNNALSVEEQWESFQPIYNRFKNTGYVRSVLLGIKKLHHIAVTDLDSIKRINRSLEDMYSRDALYTYALQKVGNIDLILLYGTLTEDHPDFFREVRFINNLVDYTEPENLRVYEEQFDMKVHRLADFVPLYEKYVARAKAENVLGFKCSLAYSRSIDFSHYDLARAHDQLKTLLTFQKSRNRRGQALTLETGVDLSNYCMNVFLEVIEREGMPISFHTGHTGGNRDIRDTNPTNLTDLIKEYRGVNFDIFHGGFPYVTQFTEMGKAYHNVYLNLCWCHILYPAGTRAQLADMLECVPVYKIFAFGDDIGGSFPELVLGHLEMAKENVAVVLADKVLAGYFTEAEALDYARRMFRNNLIEFYDLDMPLE